jgi:hypothetical protein
MKSRRIAVAIHKRVIYGSAIESVCRRSLAGAVRSGAMMASHDGSFLDTAVGPDLDRRNLRHELAIICLEIRSTGSPS